MEKDVVINHVKSAFIYLCYLATCNSIILSHVTSSEWNFVCLCYSLPVVAFVSLFFSITFSLEQDRNRIIYYILCIYIIPMNKKSVSIFLHFHKWLFHICHSFTISIPPPFTITSNIKRCVFMLLL